MHRRIGPPGSFWGLWFGNSLADGVFQFSASQPHRVASDRHCGQIPGDDPVPMEAEMWCLGRWPHNSLARSVAGHRRPFEGWSTPDGPAIWFAEIFPSLVRYPEWSDEYKTKRDRTQVQSCIRYAAKQDSAGILKRDFAKPGTLDAATLAKVEDAKGWILGVSSRSCLRQPRLPRH